MKTGIIDPDYEPTDLETICAPAAGSDLPMWPKGRLVSTGREARSFSRAAPTKPTKPTKPAVRRKHRTQISVRIDITVMAIANKTCEQHGIRLTELIERGMLLALRELYELDDPAYRHARMILRAEGVEFSRLCMNVLAIIRMPEVRELTPTENLMRKYLLDGIESVTQWPDYDKVLKLMGIPGAAKELT